MPLTTAAATTWALSTAWTLRQLVVPRMGDAEDLSSLALALPSALCSPCFLRIAELSQFSVAPKRTTALAAVLAGQATPRPLQELARRCPGLGHALLEDPRGRGLLASALALACGRGHTEAVGVLTAAPYSLGRKDLLLRPPFLMGHAEALACNALEAAAGLRSVAVLNVLAAEPYSVCSGNDWPLDDCWGSPHSA
eukprot:m51a1_g13005 hypothetical protein (196) ;mRNA; f:453-1481